MVLMSLFSLPLLGSLRAPERLGPLAVVNMPNGFAVLKENKIYAIEADAVDSTLRTMNYKQRAAYMLKGGSLELNQANTNEYTLKSVANLKGGGPISGAIAYWVTKSFCWAGVGAAATAATTAVVVAAVAMGGAAVGASAGAVAATTAAATTGVSIGIGAAGGGALGAAGASMGAAAIATSASATAAATTVTTGIVTAGGAVGLVASIETASLAAGTAFTLCPFLP